jgi:S1-C subfamily serine protease
MKPNSIALHITLLYGILHAMSSQAQPQTGMALTQAIAEVGPFVVQVLCDYDAIPRETATHSGAGFFLRQLDGSGFLVDKGGYVITAAHVVDALDNCPTGINGQDGRVYPLGPRKSVVAVVRPSEEVVRGNSTESLRGASNDFSFEVIEKDEGHDLALLKLEKNPIEAGKVGPELEGKKTYSGHLATFCTRRPQEGESIATSGFPLGKQILMTTSGTIASSWDWDQREVPIPGSRGTQSIVKDVYLADLHVNGGNSGGPVYSPTTAAIVGVMVAFDVAPVQYQDGAMEQAEISGRKVIYNSGLAVMIPIRYAAELMKKHGLIWNEACVSGR